MQARSEVEPTAEARARIPASQARQNYRNTPASLLYPLTPSQPHLISEYKTQHSDSPHLSQAHRKAFRALRALRQDIAQKYPELALPSAWLLRHVVHEYFSPSDEYTKDIAIQHFLKHLLHATQSAEALIDQASQKPLFPTQEGLTHKQFMIFITFSLKLLESQV